MSEIRDNIFGENLKRARIMTGFSLQELSNKIDNKVSKQALSKYEKGVMKPNSELIIKLSTALKVRPDFFYSNPSIKVELTDIKIHKLNYY